MSEEGFVRSARRDGIASEEEGKRKEEGCSQDERSGLRGEQKEEGSM